MRHRLVTLAGTAATAALLLCSAIPTAAQTPKASAKTSGARRMADGHPGQWTAGKDTIRQ